VSCHLSKYQATTNPNHVTAGFPQTCELCHTTTQWPGAKFDHNTQTKFPLSGKHATVQCTQCHVGGKYAGTVNTCVGCHLAKYQATTNPNHVQAGFPQTCELCHTTAQWPGATFNHTATKFPLTGKHTTLTCNQCHASGQYATLPTTCVSCHLAKYQATTNPNHVQAGFPQTCELCHTTTQWPGATFNHNTMTTFTLTGKHTTVQCTNCHVGNKFAGTPRDCYSCHSALYLAQTNPNHVGANFSRSCETCHTTTQWSGTRYNAHKFPIYSGSHQGKWTTCNDCHTTPTNYNVFACTVCHAHDKTTMDNKHKNNKNYVYNSTNCYSCHPRGSS
jgi:nitrate/TMAO reductase-like tetraheme cytochrome c subunit